MRSPSGLKDYLAKEIEGKELVSDQVFSGKVERPGGHGSLEWAVAWMAAEDGFSSSYCNTIPTPEGGTHAASAGQARRLHQCRRRRLRALHRRGRFGRRLGKAGARPRDPGRAPF